MNNEQIMLELQSSFDSDYGVSSILIENIKRILQENEELKQITKTYNTFCIPHKEDKIIFADKNYFDRGIFSCNLITITKVKEKIEEIKNYTYSTKEERQCQNYAIDRLKELMEVDNE